MIWQGREEWGSLLNLDLLAIYTQCTISCDFPIGYGINQITLSELLKLLLTTFPTQNLSF